MATATVEKVGIEPKVVIMKVTQQNAEDWLGKNHDRNRKMRMNKVREYIEDMKAGRWVLSDQAITFDVHGNLINGQHRLRAVWECGVEITSIVLFNCPDKSMIVIDGGMKRSSNDHFSMAGKEYPAGCGAMVRRVLMGLDVFAGRSISDWKVDEFMQEHGSHVAFVHTATTKYKVTLAAVRAVLVRAKIKRTAGERLERFCQVLNTGIMGVGENAAVLLRNYILGRKNKVADSGDSRQELYALTESALKSFLAGEKVTKIKPTKEELFPISGDKVNI